MLARGWSCSSTVDVIGIGTVVNVEGTGGIRQSGLCFVLVHPRSLFGHIGWRRKRSASAMVETSRKKYQRIGMRFAANTGSRGDTFK